MVEKKLLVISSDSELFSGMERFLKGKPLEARLARNSAEARQLLTEFKPDAFLIDLHLPDGNGFAIFGALKRNLALKNKIFLICAEEKDAAAVEQHRKLRKHAERYLIKPFMPETFYNALAPMLMLPMTEVRREPQPPTLDVMPLDLPDPEDFVMRDPGTGKGKEEEVLDELDSLLGDMPDNMLDTLVARKEADLSELDEMLGVESEPEEETVFEPLTIKEKVAAPEGPHKSAVPFEDEDSDILDGLKEIVDAELDTAVEETLVENLRPEEIAPEDTVVRNMVQEELAEVLEDEASLDKIVEEALGNPSELDDEIVQAVLEDVEREIVKPETSARKTPDVETATLDFDAEDFPIQPEPDTEARETAEGSLKAMLERRLAEALEDLDRERASLDMVRRQVAQLEEKFTIADTENRKLHRELSEKDEELAAMQDRLLHKDAELNAHTDVLKNRDSEVASLNSDLLEANRQLQLLEEQLAAGRAEKTQLEAELDDLRKERAVEVSRLEARLLEMEHSHKAELARLEEERAREITEVRRSGDERISELGRSLDDAVRQRDELSAKLAELQQRHTELEEQHRNAGQASQDFDVKLELLEAEAEELRELNQKNEQRLVKAYALIKSEMEARARAEQKLKSVQELLGLNK